MTKIPVKIDTLLPHAGDIDSTHSSAIIPPIQTSTTFARDREYQLSTPEMMYGRDDNELFQKIESLICQLENGEESRVFASGMATISTIFRSTPSNSTIIVQSGIYWGTTLWVREYCTRNSIKLIETDTSKTSGLAGLIEQHMPFLVFVEMPSNPWLAITDIESAANTCHQNSSILVVDATVATPLNCQPLKLGADLSIHSATKALNGHSDIFAGVVTTKNSKLPIWKFICDERKHSGAILGSFEAWLLLRGLRTLSLRVERMNKNAHDIAQYLSQHNQVETVFYPGLPHHPNHQIAKEQMQNGFGYLLSFTFTGNKKATLQCAGKLNIIKRATSLGGLESLIEHRNTIEGEASQIPENFLRISVGVENIQDLINDLEQALSKK